MRTCPLTGSRNIALMLCLFDASSMQHPSRGTLTEEATYCQLKDALLIDGYIGKSIIGLENGEGRRDDDRKVWSTFLVK